MLIIYERIIVHTAGGSVYHASVQRNSQLLLWTSSLSRLNFWEEFKFGSKYLLNNCIPFTWAGDIQRALHSICIIFQAFKKVSGKSDDKNVAFFLVAQTIETTDRREPPFTVGHRERASRFTANSTPAPLSPATHPCF